MAPRPQNHGVVYAGRVGKFRPLKKSTGCTPGLRTVIKHAVRLDGGPMDGHVLRLADRSCTLPISMGGQVGRYVMLGEMVRTSMKWEPQEAR